MDDIRKENSTIAKEYKELLKLVIGDYLLMIKTTRKAFDVAVDEHKNQMKKIR